MEVKPGYKQTEVGVIPDDWEVDYIENLAQITTGGKNTQDRIEDGQYPFFVRSQTVERINTYSYDGEAVLTAGDGVGTGKVFHYINGKFDVHQRVYRISEFNECINGYFFFLYFSSRFYNRIMQMTAKSSVDSVRREMIAKMLVPIPPKAEQEAIAEALSDADALIESLEQLIAKKRQIKQGAMQELLTGKKRLPGFSDDWEVKRLGEIAMFFSGGTPSTAVSDYYAGEIPWITSGDLNKSYIYEVQGRISKSGLENSAAKMIEANTLLIALYGATAGVTAISKIQAAINQAVLAIVPHYDDTYFLYFMLSHRKEWLITTYTQGGQPNLSGEIVKSVEFSRPSKEEQTAIAAILSDMDAEIAALEAKLTKARQLKQGMMQELLTGRIRLI